MSRAIKSVVVLSVICLALAVALAGVNALTLPVIEEAERAATVKALAVVYPDSEDFTPVDLSKYDNIPGGIMEAYLTDDGGYVIKISAAGYQSGMVIICGVNPDGEVVKAECLSSNETWGREKTFGEHFGGKTLDTVDTVATSTSKTENGYKSAIKDILGTAAILSGGSYDNRTEHEIKLDEALPSANGEFETVFVEYEVEGLNTLYKAKNDTGYVLIFGETYIGADASGKAVTNTESPYAAGIEDSLAAIMNETSATVSLDGISGIPETIESVRRTERGVYVITATKLNYYGKNLTVKLAITEEYKIISCFTVEQNESPGYGDACALDTYYTQYNGKTDTNYTDVILAGATNTNTSYQSIIKDAIDTVKLLSGGAE